METPGTSRSFKRRFPTDVDPMPGQGPTIPALSSAAPVQVERKEDRHPLDSADDERKLLNIFPEEIWLKVLGSVNPPDLETVNNASPFFRRLLYPDRSTFLFSSVWKVLGVLYEYDYNPPYLDQELEDSHLNVARKKGKEFFLVIIKLRLVCREWCLAVDKFYEDLYSYDTTHSVIKARVESGLDSSDELKIKRNYWKEIIPGPSTLSDFKFKVEDKVQGFLDHFMATHDSQRNPFPFRKVIFCPEYDDFIEYCSRVIQLLTKHGHHIWFCKIHINFDLAPPEIIRIQEMLTLMPNLKVLRLRLWRFHTSDPEMTKEEKEEIKEALVTHPLPKLQSLTMVSFVSTPKIIMEHILRKNDHVQKVEIPNGMDYLDFVHVPLPKLTHLAVRLDSVEEFEQLEQWGPLWKLEMLHLDFRCNLYISHSRILKCVEQWRNSLTDVVVCLPHAKGEEEKTEFVRKFEMRLDLPNVKRLRIQMQNIRSLDLILPMRNSLELLEYTREWKAKDWETIPKEVKDEMRRKEVIQFHSVENDDMYNSNIWSLFPKLGRIHAYDHWPNCYSGPSYIRQKRMDLEDQ